MNTKSKSGRRKFFASNPPPLTIRPSVNVWLFGLSDGTIDEL